MSEQPVVVITGASSGIGYATALRFARKKARLVLVARREKALRAVARDCEELGAEAVVVIADVTVSEEVATAADVAVARFGRIDVWVNNAAVSVFAPFLETPLDDFRRVIDVDQLGYVYGARAALRVMEQQGRGTLVNVASVVGEVPQPYVAPYAMSKAAVRALGVSLREELRLAHEKRVHVVTVLPPTIDTPFFQHSANYTGRRVIAMPPVYPPDQVAKAIVSAGLARRPDAEIVVGKIGRALVRQHRAAPAAAELQMAVQTETMQLSPVESAPATKGTLYRPSSAESAAITGGWKGRERTTGRVLLGGIGAAAVALLVVRAVGTRRSRS
jgi:short-subunit dehydrogenase